MSNLKSHKNCDAHINTVINKIIDNKGNRIAIYELSNKGFPSKWYIIETQTNQLELIDANSLQDAKNKLIARLL